MEKREKTIEVIKVVILGLVISWIIFFFIDYFRARNGKMPLICVSKNTMTYDDGTVQSCTGLGYKMYKYDRTSIKTSVEFGPFFIKERKS